MSKFLSDLMCVEQAFLAELLFDPLIEVLGVLVAYVLQPRKIFNENVEKTVAGSLKVRGLPQKYL